MKMKKKERSMLNRVRSLDSARDDGSVRGFTLLELLVVIGIIGVLTALATVAYSTTQRNGRNMRRKQDLVAIQSALEQYYSENNFGYPDTHCTLASAYLKGSWPVDPSSTTTTPILYSGQESCSTSSYCVCGELESQIGGNSSDTTCQTGTWVANGRYYCVGNLQ